jgi:anti-anti-sigma factor
MGSDEMFNIERLSDDHYKLTGKLHAAYVDRAREALAPATTCCTLDFSDLLYISSAGLGVLMTVQKRLDEAGTKLKIVNSNDHVKELLKVARFDLIFDIE